ncbi:transglutaminaseTgpA domain-containing protein [Actinoplanes auranticolor]|uniref:transglutaminase family protein n=1 Tax=Actinoplanes auranticolor TaxID=47988 RepID=UPI003373D9A2
MALVILIGLSGVVLGRIYADALLTQLVAGAALGSVGVSVAARRLPSWTIAPMSVVLLGGYTLGALRVAADRAEMAGSLTGIVTDALVNGIPRLLTAMIPVESTPDTVVVPVVAAWLAGLAGAEVALRSGRVLLGCVPAAALYGGALYVVGPNAGTAGWPTVLFAGLVAVALAVSARPASGPALSDVPPKTRAAVRGRALAGAAAGLVVLLGLIVVVGPWVGGRVSATPVDPRRYVEPPQVDSLDESPLNRISGWALTPEQKLLEVGPGVAGPGPVRLRLAVLPDYDGVTWRVGATYRNAGRVLPTAAALPDVPLRRVTQDITVAELTGRLLPVVPTPTGVDGVRVAYDPASGTLISPEGLKPGVRYTVTSQAQEPDFNLLPSADSPTGDEVARFLTVGAGVPDNVTRLAEQLADGNAGAFDRAAAIEEFLAEHYRKVADSPSGHAYPNLQFFLFGPRNQGGQRGTSEQFAASFALLARLTGLPARVVVGFDVPKNGGPVTGGDAVAWPEVLFDELGWVAFDPLPKSDQPRPVEEDFTPKPSPPPTSEPPPASEAPSASAPPVVAQAPVAGDGGASGVWVATGASGSVLLLVIAAGATVVVMRRGLRQRRLGVGAPDERITGAWWEFTDALRLAGRPVPGHLAASEAAAFAALPPVPRQRKGWRFGRLRVGSDGSGTGPGGSGAGGSGAGGSGAGGSGAGGSGAGLNRSGAELGGSAGGPSGSGGDSGMPGAGMGGRSARQVGVTAGPGQGDGAGPGPTAGIRGPGATSEAGGGAVAVDAASVGWRPEDAPDRDGLGLVRAAAPPAGYEMPPLDELVAAVNTVGFAPGAADEQQAERAGQQAVAYAEALRAKRSWWRRLWWSLHPGPLRWHRD